MNVDIDISDEEEEEEKKDVEEAEDVKPGKEESRRDKDDKDDGGLKRSSHRSSRSSGDRDRDRDRSRHKDRDKDRDRSESRRRSSGDKDRDKDRDRSRSRRSSGGDRDRSESRRRSGGSRTRDREKLDKEDGGKKDGEIEDDSSSNKGYLSKDLLKSGEAPPRINRRESRRHLSSTDHGGEVKRSSTLEGKSSSSRQLSSSRSHSERHLKGDDDMRHSRRGDKDKDRDKDRDRDRDRDKDKDRDRRRSERHGDRRSSEKDRDRHRDHRKSSDRDRERRSSDKDRDKDREDRDKDKDKDRDKDKRKETREERDERKRKEKEEKEKEEQRQKERRERREKEREERKRKDEEKKKEREALREERRKSKGGDPHAHRASTLQVNRADLRQISTEKFSDVYSLGKKIYKGDDTKVHVCNHRATGTERCVKITPKKSSSCHEFDMLKNMDHPNILAMYDLFVEEDDMGFEWFLVVDLCKGGSLYNYLQKRSCSPYKEAVDETPQPDPSDDPFGLGGLVSGMDEMVKTLAGEVEEESDVEEGDSYGMPEDEVKKVMLQVLSCVNYLHKNRLVHADIKPQNVLLSTKKDLSTIKMLDFDNSALLKKADDKIGIKKGTPEYMAPEVHAGNKYDYKCDLWSCGVMAYQLLSNTLPFGDSRELSEEEIALKVEEGKYSMAGPAWGSVSEDAKDFVKHLLIVRDKKRPTAEKAIMHKYLAGGKKGAEAAVATTASLSGNTVAMGAMSNFRKFKADSKLKKATCAFIASQLLTKEEKDKIDAVFRAMDITRDGKLSKTEVKAGFFQCFGTFLSDKEIDEMFERVDCDGTGEIEYSEFVIASMSETDLLSTDRLRKAFQLFDKDNSGSITISELREIFQFFQTAGADMDEEYIDRVIAQVDHDGDGDVSFDEFCDMMRNGIPV